VESVLIRCDGPRIGVSVWGGDGGKIGDRSGPFAGVVVIGLAVSCKNRSSLAPPSSSWLEGVSRRLAI